MISRHDFHRLREFGTEINGPIGRFSHVLFATDACGRFIMAEAFPGNQSEYWSLRQSWYYKTLGSCAAEPSAANRVPVFKCRYWKGCEDESNSDGEKEWACFSVQDNNVDLDNLFLNNPEPRILSSYNWIFENYRERLSRRAQEYNAKLENVRFPIERTQERLYEQFTVLWKPDAYRETGWSSDATQYMLYNDLVEVCN